MNREKKVAYKIGDEVRIINPEVFIRCGYPKTKADIEANLTDDQKKIIDNFLFSFNLTGEGYTTEKIRRKVTDAVCFGLLDQCGYGGRERSIHTECSPKIKDRVGRVVGKKVVRTGVYIHSWGGYDYYNGGEEFCPAYLEKVKSHVILELDIVRTLGNIFDWHPSIMIESKNVEKCEELDTKVSATS